MILLLDSNVVLDYLLHREGFKEANEIIQLALSEKELECVTVPSITDINYIAGKAKDSEGKKFYTTDELQELLSDLFTYLLLITSSDKDVKLAWKLKWKDFEDALQYTTAISNGVDYIITSNVKDFETPIIPIMTPKEFLDMYENK